MESKYSIIQSQQNYGCHNMYKIENSDCHLTLNIDSLPALGVTARNFSTTPSFCVVVKLHGKETKE